MFPVREDEPKYVFLRQQPSQSHNQHGDFINLLQRTAATAGESLQINGDPAVGENPDRNKQHGFHFTADNCIACHACEAACSEKNDNPAHLAFRSAGYVGGAAIPATPG